MCLFWFGLEYDLRQACYSLNTVFKDTSCSRLSTSGDSVMCSGMTRLVSPHPDYWTHALCNQLWVSWSSTIVFNVYLALKTNWVHWKTPLCFLIPFGSPQCDSTRFQRWVCLPETSDHLDTKFCLGVTGIYLWVCVWLRFERVISTC